MIIQSVFYVVGRQEKLPRNFNYTSTCWIVYPVMSSNKHTLIIHRLFPIGTMLQTNHAHYFCEQPLVFLISKLRHNLHRYRRKLVHRSININVSPAGHSVRADSRIKSVWWHIYILIAVGIPRAGRFEISTICPLHCVEMDHIDRGLLLWRAICTYKGCRWNCRPQQCNPYCDGS